MIQKLIIFLIALVMFPCLSHGESIQGEAYLRYTEGDIQMKMSDSLDWVPTTANAPLFEGDRLWSPPDGRADIHFRNGTSVRVGKSTIVELGRIEGNFTEVYVDEGTIYINFKGSSGSALVVYARDAAFRTDNPGVFRVDVPQRGDTSISALSGTLYLNRGNGEMRLGPGQRVVMTDRGIYPQVTGLLAEDEWGRWNRQRDWDAYGRVPTAGSQYLPPELSSYSSELDSNGRWAYTPDYGYVWTPTLTVAMDWSPYKLGRWVWMRGDYVWISHEPWGWVPYHYGRWVYASRVGWCWVPPSRGDVFWGPGYVAWINTASYISWVPLAPKEVYYGRGYHGQHSVDLLRATVPPQPVNLSYRNAQINNAVTSVHRDSFLRNRPTEAKLKDNPFHNRDMSVALSPPPPRVTTTPSAHILRDVQRGKEPPERFLQNPQDRFRVRNIPPPVPGNTREPQVDSRPQSGVQQAPQHREVPPPIGAGITTTSPPSAPIQNRSPASSALNPAMSKQSPTDTRQAPDYKKQPIDRQVANPSRLAPTTASRTTQGAPPPNSAQPNTNIPTPPPVEAQRPSQAPTVTTSPRIDQQRQAIIPPQRPESSKQNTPRPLLTPPPAANPATVIPGTVIRKDGPLEKVPERSTAPVAPSTVRTAPVSPKQDRTPEARPAAPSQIKGGQDGQKQSIHQEGPIKQLKDGEKVPDKTQSQPEKDRALNPQSPANGR